MRLAHERYSSYRTDHSGYSALLPDKHRHLHIPVMLLGLSVKSSQLNARCLSTEVRAPFIGFAFLQSLSIVAALHTALRFDALQAC